MDDSISPTEARRLEVAHFADGAASRKFEAEFREYLIPGMLDGPELAPEVARLEGLSGLWEPVGNSKIDEVMKADHALVKQAADWRIHDPNLESSDFEI
jgi:hypothetical protein